MVRCGPATARAKVIPSNVETYVAGKLSLKLAVVGGAVSCGREELPQSTSEVRVQFRQPMSCSQPSAVHTGCTPEPAPAA